MKIHTFTDNGGSIARGTVEVGGYHPSPVVLDAQTTAVTITGAAVNKYSLFTVTTDGATDIVELASDIPVGSKFVIVPAAGCDIDVQSGGSANGGADTASLPIASGSHAEVLCIAANTFLVEQVTAAGARTAPTAV